MSCQSNLLHTSYFYAFNINSKTHCGVDIFEYGIRRRAFLLLSRPQVYKILNLKFGEEMSQKELRRLRHYIRVGIDRSTYQWKKDEFGNHELILREEVLIYE